jgi:hypothetical protein
MSTPGGSGAKKAVHVKVCTVLYLTIYFESKTVQLPTGTMTTVVCLDDVSVFSGHFGIMCDLLTLDLLDLVRTLTYPCRPSLQYRMTS